MLILDRTLVLSVRVALLGEVVPRLRAVTISARKSIIQLNCYFQDTLIEQDYELASVMSTEIVSDFSTDDDGNWITIKCDALRLDPPEKIPNTGILAYHRYEQDFLLAKEPFPFAMTGEGFRPDIYICFVAWRALLGRILPDFRAIYAFKEKAVIKAYFLIEGPISNLARNLAEQACKEMQSILSDEDSNPIVQPLLIRRDFPASFPQLPAVYVRHESSITQDPHLRLADLVSD